LSPWDIIDTLLARTLLENGYYLPAPGQPTFDSFIYDEARKTATMLQMTVAICHDAKAKAARE